VFQQQQHQQQQKKRIVIVFAYFNPEICNPSNQNDRRDCQKALRIK
jgi:hypothetical protein